MELMRAHREWASRPADERFQSLDDLLTAVRDRREESVQYNTGLGGLKVVVLDQDGQPLAERDATPENPGVLKIETPLNELTPTHWSFGGLSRMAGAPAKYLRELPAHLAARNLEHGINQSAEHPVQVYLQQGEDPKLRALTGQGYERIFDQDLVEWVQNCTAGTSFAPPMGYENGQWGGKLVPSGLYASDRDVFVFLVDHENPVEFNGERLFRGFYVWNSEVGGKSFGGQAFLHREVCGNNIIWGAANVVSFRQVHVGALAGTKAQRHMRQMIEQYKQMDTRAECQMIGAAQAANVAKDDEEAVTWLRGKGFQKGVSEAAVTLARAEEGGAGTVWQLVQGLTAYARSIANADLRSALERQAGKLLDRVARS